MVFLQKIYAISYIKCINFVYDDNSDYDYLTKFEAYSIKDNDLYQFTNDYDIILDNYIDKHSKFSNQDIKNIEKEIYQNNIEYNNQDIYYTENLSNALFVDFKELAKINWQL